MVGHTGTGTSAVLLAPQPRPIVPGAADRRRWQQAIAHLTAGLRLRQALGRAAVEATLDPAGRLHDAARPAASASAREALREAVRRIEHARSSAGRRDPDGSLAHWRGLAAGRWSLVDRFDRDGKRFLVAVRNDPAQPDPRGLSERARQIAELVGLGHSTKQIAYARRPLGREDRRVLHADRAAGAGSGPPPRAALRDGGLRPEPFFEGGISVKLGDPLTVSGDEAGLFLVPEPAPALLLVVGVLTLGLAAPTRRGRPAS